MMRSMCGVAAAVLVASCMQIKAMSLETTGMDGRIWYPRAVADQLVVGGRDMKVVLPEFAVIKQIDRNEEIEIEGREIIWHVPAGSETLFLNITLCFDKPGCTTICSSVRNNDGKELRAQLTNTMAFPAADEGYAVTDVNMAVQIPCDGLSEGGTAVTTGRIMVTPHHGTAEVIQESPLIIEYTPDLWFSGFDEFEYQVSDGVYQNNSTIIVNVGNIDLHQAGMHLIEKPLFEEPLVTRDFFLDIETNQDWSTSLTDLVDFCGGPTVPLFFELEEANLTGGTVTIDLDGASLVYHAPNFEVTDRLLFTVRSATKRSCIEVIFHVHVV